MDGSAPGGDARPPPEVARRLERAGVEKAATDATTLLALAVLAGAFVSLGAVLSAVVVSGSTFGFGLTRLVGGVAFSLGLVLVVVAGAELFTGNNLLAMAWASRLVAARSVVRNWVLVYLGNALGALATVGLVLAAEVHALGGGLVRETAVAVARQKADLDLGTALARGVLCNALVCLAVWLSTAGRSVSDRILAVVFPVAAFVALGLEHSIANWFFLPYGILLDSEGVVSVEGAGRNLVAVTAGNLLGGTVLVASVYWLAYLRGAPGRRGGRR